MRGAFTYIMSNKSHTLYVGATTNLERRVLEHKRKQDRNAFTARYRFTRLVWFEVADDMAAAERRERQIKAWSRMKKITLIQDGNPNWDDLSRRLTALLRLQ